jgi:hypothetical protein
MTYVHTGGAEAAAAMANAVKASGAIVRVSPADFALILAKTSAPLVVHATTRFFTITHKYLTAYKGLVFFTKSPEPLMLSGGAEVVEAGKIWVPE